MKPRFPSRELYEASLVSLLDEDIRDPAVAMSQNLSAEELAAIESLENDPEDPVQARYAIRRTFTARTRPDPFSNTVAGSGQAIARSLGPFRDPSGRQVSIDVLQSTVTPPIAIQRVGAPGPFAYISTSSLSGTVSIITLDAGSIWFPAQQFTTVAAASAYIGLQILSGTISFSSPVSVDVTPVVISDGIAVIITLSLVASAVTDLIDGASAQTPAEVSFSFTAAGSSLGSASSSSLNAFDTTTDFTFTDAPAEYDSTFGRVLFPLQPEDDNLAVTKSTSKFAKFSGNATIILAAWSIPTTNATPDTLGTAAGPGGLSLSLSSGLNIATRAPELSIDCGACTLLIESDMLTIGGMAATTSASMQNIGLYEKSSLAIRPSPSFSFRYISEPTDTETWGISAAITATLDQPRTINNERVRLAGSGVFVLSRIGTTIKLEAITRNEDVTRESFAIRNLLLQASVPQSVLVTGTFEKTKVTEGTVTLDLTLYSALPFLPDPYATNFESTTNEDSLGALTIVLNWQANREVIIDVTLPTTASGSKALTGMLGTRTTTGGKIDLSILAEDRPIPTFLDVSTNVSQFGVVIGQQTSSSLSISDLYLQAPNNSLVAMALPAVQWEPVVTTPNPLSFPSPLTFPNDGPATLIGTKSVTLVPIAPRQTLDGILEAYNSDSPQEVAARFTLPFGMVATTTVTPSASPLFASPGLKQVQPTFNATKLTGCDQISFTPAFRRIVPRGVQQASPSLEGTTTLLQNAMVNGAATTTTVLSPIDESFNPTFGSSGSNPSVPVTRIDISGYGESTFSDWRNPADAAATICKVNFNVLLGRTSREVVQLYSIKYPWGVRVVRTITIDRQNSGVMVRSDSGWQAVSDGYYEFPHPWITTHASVVTGITKVTNIRDTGSTYTTSDGSQLMGVVFDCHMKIENVLGGARKDGTVPAQNLLAYVQLTDRTAQPPLGQLAADQYAELIAAVGPMGGQIDCLIEIGDSNLRMKVKSVGVSSTTDPSGNIEFAMQAGGAPTLPKGGQWTFVSQASGNPSPQTIDPINGVPLVRRNTDTTSQYPYIFQNGTDLLPTTPETYFCLMHATHTQRLIFPQPQIQPDSQQLTSTVPPFLADPYVLAIATGPFPRTSLCIPFNDANYSLLIGKTGNFTLQLPQPTFTTNIQPRILRNAKNMETIAYCTDEKGVPSAVTVTIHTGTKNPWSVSITNLSLAASSGSLGEIFRFIGDIYSDSHTPTRLRNSRILFGSAFQPVQAVVSFLENFGPIPEPTVHMTTPFHLKGSLKFNLQELLKLVPGLAALLAQFVINLNVQLIAKVSAQDTSMDMDLGLTVKVKTPFQVIAVGIAKFEIHMADAGNVYIITLGAGMGVDFTILDSFKATAYFAVTQSLIIGDTEFGVGTGTLLKGTVDLEVVEVDLEVEASMALIKVSCTDSQGDPASTIWGWAQVSVALEVHIFAILNIGFSWHTELKNNFDGGPCPLVATP